MHKPQDVIRFIDLTSLGDDDTEQDIVQLCQQATTPFGHVASVCAFQRFVPLMREQLTGTGVKVCTVSNFPAGGDDITATRADIEHATRQGANEIDIVLPYKRFLAGDTAFCSDFIAQCRSACDSALLKVIIEISALKTADNIKAASELAIDAGAQFIKTSTGKLGSGATIDATQVMLSVIRDKHADIGFKASGSIRTTQQALSYLQCASDMMGVNWLQPQHFRIGASSLLTDVLNQLTAEV